MTAVPGETIQAGPSLSGSSALLAAAHLPSSDLSPSHMEHFFYSGTAAAPAGIVGVGFRGSNALLRSLVVSPNARSTGLGAALLERAEAHARGRGAVALYLLTTTAEQLFRKRGYFRRQGARACRDSYEP